MKKIISIALAMMFILTAALSVSSASIPSANLTEEDANYDIYTLESDSKGTIDVWLIAGQSNAAGHGTNRQGDLVVDSRYEYGFENVLYYGQATENKFLDEFVPVKFGQGKSTETAGPEVGIASALGNQEGMNAVIKVAVGSSCLYPNTSASSNVSQQYGTWTPPSYIEKHGINTDEYKMIGQLYRDLIKTVSDGIALLKEDGYTPVIRGMWWMQGEAESSHEGPANMYEELLTTLISDVRADLGDIVGADMSDLPFVMGKITRNPTADEQPAYLPVVNAAQVTVTNTVNNTFIVDTTGLEQIDGWHYSANSQKYLGEEFVKTAIASTGKHSVIMSGYNASITGGGAKAAGEEVTVTITPDPYCNIVSVKYIVGDSEGVDIDISEGGGSYTFTMPDDSVTFAVSTTFPTAVDTEYGPIPIQYEDENTYPFALFSNGNFVKAYAKYYNFLAEAGTVVTTDSTLLLRSNWNTTDDGKSSGYLGKLGAHLTIDLGGHTITRGSYHLFQMMGYGTDISLTVKNGTIVSGSGLPPIVFNNSGASANKETVTVVFDTVTFAPSTTTKKSLIVASYGDGTGAGMTANLTFNNCTFDLTKATASGNLIFNLMENKSANKSDISVVINGGQFKVKTYNQVFADYNAPRDGSTVSPDSVRFGKYNDSYTKFIATSSSSAPAIEPITVNGDKVAFDNSGTSSAPVYELAPVTEYGIIPIKYADANAYPFILFQNGVAVKGYTSWQNFCEKGGNETTTADKNSVLYLRNNYADPATSAKQNLLYVENVVVDLGNHTLTLSGSQMFYFMCKNNNDFTMNITVKNGTIVRNNKPLIVYQGNASTTSAIDANFNVTFDNVTIKTTSASAGNFIVEAFSGGTYGCKSSLIFNNCTFDVREGNSAKFFKLEEANGQNKFDVTVIINGGQIIAKKYITLATLSEERESGKGSSDSLKFGKYEGAYTTITLASGSAPSGEFDSVEDGKVKFVETDKAGVYTLGIAHTCAPKTHVNAVIPNCIAGGNVEYWICECGIKYLDEACTKAAESVELGVDKNNHVIDLANTAWTKGEQTHYKACTCGAKLEEEAHDGLNCTVCGNQTIGVYKSGDDLYFIEWNGKLLTGKFYVTVETSNELVEAGWYYADDNGKFIKAGFFNDNGTLRYIVDGQTVYTRVTKINGKLYMIDWDGKVLTGKFYITADSANGLTTEGWHYTNADGSFIENGFYDDVDFRRYIVNGKTAYTRVTEIDGKFYMIDWDGEVKTGKFYITADSLNGYLNTSGWYYTYDDGSFINNDFHIDENGVKRYIVNGKAAYTQVTEINGDYYMIDWDGVVVINTEKFYITVNSVGVHSDKIKAGWNKTDADGKIVA